MTTGEWIAIGLCWLAVAGCWLIRRGMRQEREAEAKAGRARLRGAGSEPIETVAQQARRQ